ncbi:MAG: tagaturonate reductase [Daejeonella sp.]|uniref:tagaturonate reductase n=1 Tax=Daejeonella sp. TaxID=2805397 RepID=UPI00273391D8|nr:tagaturonate reductase [Daejeonella sp.]MDP3467301.1 tagaturonate reductase [Daejeonella sp.]
MKLNKENLGKIDASLNTEINRIQLPEKVLQFGTGVLLRALPDYFIDKANRRGIFNGRVVLIKSTDRGDTNDFNEQDSLYTIGIRGVDGDNKVELNIINSAISRVLSAKTEWQKILDVAASETLEIIISNTTELGIELIREDIQKGTPVSYPGKLLAILYHRYKVFNADENKGLIILPTELITDNGIKLRNILFELAEHNKLEPEFIKWLGFNTFCNTLVDRIVPGKPDENTLKRLEQELGYRDELFVFSEVYSLWAIEGDERIRKILSFEQADEGVIIASDITMYKELKLRLLNGTHTLSCAAAFLSGLGTVCDAMEDSVMSGFISSLMQDELARAIPYPVAREQALQFSAKVLDRFRNPHIRHQWLSISVNYSMKLKMRVIPVLLNYYKNYQSVPKFIAVGFAAYLRFMQTEELNGAYYGSSNNMRYQVDDEWASYYSGLWKEYDVNEMVLRALSNTELWDVDLSQLPAFVETVQDSLRNIMEVGTRKTIEMMNRDYTETNPA